MLLLYWPPEHGVQVVSSFVFSLFFPAVNACPAPQEVRFAEQAVLLLLLYWPSAHVVRTARNRCQVRVFCASCVCGWGRVSVADPLTR